MDTDTPGKRLQLAATSLLADMRFFCKTSQTTVNEVITGVDKLTNLFLEVILDSLKKELVSRNGYIKLQEIEQILNRFKDQSMFEGLRMRGRLELVLKRYSASEPVELKQEVITWKLTVDKHGTPRKVPHEFGYIVPFKPQLQQLLNCEDVLKCVDNPHTHHPTVYKSALDGLAYRSNVLVQTHGNGVLAFELNTDDVEVTDPCKSKVKKHRLRLFLWTLLNIYPELRSSLRAINLLVIVNTTVAKNHGNNRFLRNFVENMKEMGMTGMSLAINNIPRPFYGFLLAAICDLPAANNLGGFKETHFAKRPCRICFISKEDLCLCWVELFSLLRKKNDHERQLMKVERYKSENPETIGYTDEQIEEDDVPDDILMDSMEHETLQADKHKDPSVKYGINGRSILSELPHVDITKVLLIDGMHTFFEGICEIVCRRTLKDLCFPPQPPHVKRQKTKRVKPMLSLEQVNEYLQSIVDYDHYNVSRPTIIEKGHLTKKLRQSAAQMIVLIHTLPFIIKARVSEDVLELVCLCLDLWKMCLAFQVKMPNDIEEWKQTISKFGEKFMELFPKCKTVKLHQLIHLPTQIVLFGPLRQMWCFRFESMNQEITSPFSTLRNTINIAYSLGTYHINRRNAQIMESKGNYLYQGDKIPKNIMHPFSTLPEKSLLSQIFSTLDDSSFVCSVDYLIHNGCTYKNGVVIMAENDKFVMIEKIFLIDDQYVFAYKSLATKYIEDLRAYEVTQVSDACKCMKMSEFSYIIPIAKFCFSFRIVVKTYRVVISPEKM